MSNLYACALLMKERERDVKENASNCKLFFENLQKIRIICSEGGLRSGEWQTRSLEREIKVITLVLSRATRIKLLGEVKLAAIRLGDSCMERQRMTDPFCLLVRLRPLFLEKNSRVSSEGIIDKRFTFCFQILQNRYAHWIHNELAGGRWGGRGESPSSPTGRSRAREGPRTNQLRALGECPQVTAAMLCFRKKHMFFVVTRSFSCMMFRLISALESSKNLN